MRKFFVLAAAGMFMVTGLQAPAQALVPSDLAGVWRNPKNTVHVRISRCGSNVCGTVVWASAQAQAKAREAGNGNLIGTQLFREFRSEGQTAWAGRVFVPDMGRTFSGQLRLQNRNAVVARGCLLGRLLCKSQVWARVA